MMQKLKALDSKKDIYFFYPQARDFLYLWFFPFPYGKIFPNNLWYFGFTRHLTWVAVEPTMTLSRGRGSELQNSDSSCDQIYLY